MADHFDAYYFTVGCGERPYQRDDEWLNFYSMIADQIYKRIEPKTVLDAGCAMGFLVEGLRQRGINAYGVDVSEYAIQNTHSDIQSYCWVGSVTDPFPQKYDLIVSIEVVEHMPQQDAEATIGNLCKHSDDILFSSTPFDYKEATHFNVHPPEYWSELFAREGFLRDIDFDASFITPWAVRFRRKQAPLPRLVRDYERKFFLLWKENQDLRSVSLEMRNQLATLEDQILGLQNHIKVQLTEKDRQLTEVLNSRSWQLITRLQKLRLSFIPLGSPQEQLLRGAYNGLLRLGNRGTNVEKQVNPGTAGSMQPPSKATYQSWIQATEPTKVDLDNQKELAIKIERQPLISFITPVFDPPPSVLRDAIESVIAQTYSNWELCLVDGASSNIEIKNILIEYSQLDERIQVKFLDDNLGISGNSNEAVEMSQGEFVAIFDHDDTLAPDMLFQIVNLLNQEPNTDILYFDEDKLSEDGKTRLDPFLKPDWSPEMLLSVNYMTHPVIRRSLIKKAGYFNPDMDGTQDWDLILRCTEHTKNIAHIPKILYHWRQIQGSAAAKFNAKPYVFERQLLCVKNHLERSGLPDVQASFTAPGFLRVVWPTKGAKVSIIIPSKDNVNYLKRCLASILEKTSYSNLEIIIVDNKSSKSQTLKYYRSLKDDNRIKIVPYHDPFNFSVALNLGARHAKGELFLFLNNDTEAITADWLEEMVRWAERPEIGIVGAKLLYPDGKIQHAGVVVGMEGHASHIFWGVPERFSGMFGSVDWYRDFSAVTGACMMMRREVFEDLGGFDENYQLVFSDIEICVRALNHGYRIMYTPYARLTHFEGRSRASHIPSNDVLVGFEHLGDLVKQGDPYFNPNLSYSTRIPNLSSLNEQDRYKRLTQIADLASNSLIMQRDSASFHEPISDGILPYSEVLSKAATAGKVLHREDIYGSGPPNEYPSPEVLAIIERNAQSPLLDVGCGIGAYIGALKEKGFHSHGLEVNPDYVDQAKALNRSVELYDGEKIPYPENHFDTVMAIEVLEHISDWETTLKEMLRVSNRCVLFSVPNIGVIPALSRHHVVPWHLLESTHVNFFTKDILNSKLSEIPRIKYKITPISVFDINGNTFFNNLFVIIHKK